jgi:hypothetical protein
VFILGEVFGESNEAGAEVMDESAANFRQLLSRARRDLYQFMNGKCGLVNHASPCRCARKAAGFMRNGWLDANNLQFSKDRVAEVRNVAAVEFLRRIVGAGTFAYTVHIRGRKAIYLGRTGDLHVDIFRQKKSRRGFCGYFDLIVQAPTWTQTVRKRKLLLLVKTQGAELGRAG